MKSLKLVLAGLALSAGAALADPVHGVWKTEVDDGAYAHVTIASCGGKICGTISRTFDSGGEYQSKNLGKQIIRGMVPQGGGKYAGQVWRPSNNKLYKGKLNLSGNSLKMSGCVAGGLLCSSQTWQRIQ
ncbi:DUF2147 domain-containing protein [Primorskyibacter aestuariivivens]|uniref:DUF2147 domain-containing protein n=1 Tax=Primorskyibacter aestuariivivens TaxID=1888912 RepID=UPI002300536B|nr:DUF2147 domain-containing protein [Primorskyibacter aestuariivivens]MDA7429440.1 DUF2147 domain-containing protein [Primorskyibacter aestuariivivens]